jgi:acyl-CoA thioester hydrolase
MKKLSTALKVSYRDLDAMGHVNYATYLTFLEEAINGLWEKVLSNIGIKLVSGNLGYVSAHVEIDYLIPAVFNQTLKIEVWVTAIGKRSFTTCYEIHDADNGNLIAKAKTVQVITLIDKEKQMMPNEFRQALSEFSD